MKKILSLLFLIASIFILTLFYSCAEETIINNSDDCVSTVTYSGKTYHTVQIGTQCWLNENLDVGTRIDGSQFASNNSVIEKYCYNNDSANCTTYGGLYQWNEAMQYVTTEGAQGICPNGWHIPTYAEFQTLKDAVNIDGNSLKAIGQGTGGGAGTNTSGFSALLAGGRGGNGSFVDLGGTAYFWSSKEHGAPTAGTLLLHNDSYVIWDAVSGAKEVGFCVRCVKD